MPWHLTFHPDAIKELKKLDGAAAARIVKTLESRIAILDDPRGLGSPLKGDHDGYWRWRIGHFRVIARLNDASVTILVVRVAHRREVYR